MIIGCIIGILTIMFLIVLYLIKPNQKRIEALPVRLFAHRGLHGKGIPENTLKAFRMASERNFGVELDVRFTLDKKVVVFHDDSLKRLCGRDIKVGELTYDALQSCNIAGSDEKIPLLTEALEVLNGVPVICEIKSDNKGPIEELCVAVSDIIKKYNGFICIESFDPFVVRWFRKNRPEVIRGQLSMRFTTENSDLSPIKAFMMRNLFVNVFSRPDFIAYRYRDDSFGYFLCRCVFKPLCIPWTVKGKKDITEASGVYGSVIFEEIDA
ncbi:glycerophosphodiester phosphodiesterase [Thermoclostridium stercorarium subsp. leptospartum DSM 9219]|uniref:Glycerophosphodiester phosphodiesterase n=1 Tax=Thermoclostridium stercorarium subsp. leptospartum DSM 9219 TaxID=1346611 RepID=A0A1B1YL91_THEST|nr:glycerophosphodiester phosphodiesterase family protein [Thermoclostridium stercorarium]ANX01494.1 glycerophosphodiester phosphodiesterase [Thermoclostridium stercorarium subsp. leptospartum DSM 9219]